MDRQSQRIDPRTAEINNCLFCRASRLTGKGGKAWHAQFKIIIGYYGTRSFTICPKCREEHKINDIFTKVVDTMVKKWEKYDKDLQI